MKREEQAKQACINWVCNEHKDGDELRILDAYISAVAWADAHPNWISVEERLPDELGKTQQSISVWATDGLTTCEMIYHFDIKKWSDIFGDWFDVTHWMPLPTPPRKEDKK